MTETHKTFIRIAPGADSCEIKNCEAYIHTDSDRSFVDSAAANTTISNSRMIEIGKSCLKARGKLFVVLALLGGLVNIFTLMVFGKNFWSFFTK